MSVADGCGVEYASAPRLHVQSNVSPVSRTETVNRFSRESTTRLSVRVQIKAAVRVGPGACLSLEVHNFVIFSQGVGFAEKMHHGVLEPLPFVEPNPKTVIRKATTNLFDRAHQGIVQLLRRCTDITV